jgi:hypothetical protein
VSSAARGWLKIVSCLALLFTITSCSQPTGSWDLENQDWQSLDFRLESSSIVAGDSVDYTAELVSAAGARLPVPVALASDIELSLRYSATDITPALAGTHLLTATAAYEGEEFSGTQSLTVTGGEPVSIEITLADETPDVDQRVAVTAVIRDATGFEVDAPWTLTVEAEPGSDASSVTIDGHAMIFGAEGWFRAIGTVDQNGVRGEYGPFVVDSFPPIISLTHPPRGLMTNATNDSVTGTVVDSFTDIAEVAVNGVDVSLGSGGSFSQAITYGLGFNLVETVASDVGGSTATDRRAVLSGQFQPRGSSIAEGIMARVNQSTLDAVEDWGEDLVESYDIGSLVPDPAYSNSSESCALGVCWTNYELVLHIDSVTMGHTDLEIVPHDGGYLTIQARIHDIAVDWRATGAVLGIGYSASGTITADSVTISARLTPSVSGGRIHVDVSEVTVTSENFVFDWDSWIYDVATFFGLDASGMVQGYIEDAIRGAVVDMVPTLLEDTLADLTLGTTFELFGNSYALAADPYDVDVDSAGITLALSTRVDPVEWRISRETLGSLYRDFAPPTYPATPGLLASFSLDFINQALHAFWGGGLLTQQLDVEALGFDPGMLSLIMPSLADTQIIVIDAYLPPVAMPGTGDHLADLHLGDLEIIMYSGDPSDPSNLLLHLFIGLDAALDLAVSPDMTLAPTLSDIVAWVDVTEPILPNNFEVDTELLLQTMVPVLSGQINAALGEIPIPEIAGFGLADPTIEIATDDGGFISVAGELSGL